jgi:hypothetical protein
MSKRWGVGALIALALTITLSGASVAPEPLLAHIKFLASDEMKGRGDGSPELERAADYIGAQLKMIGLEPGGADGTYFQPFEIVAGLEIGADNQLILQSSTQGVRLKLGESYFPIAVTPSDSATALSQSLDNVPLVFAGYGITSPRYRYDDYAGIDVRGKAVLIFSHEPQETQRTSRLNGAQPINETSVEAKATAARSHGARALIVVSDPSHRVDQANFTLFPIDPDTDDEAIPILRVSRTAMLPLLREWGLDQVAVQIDSDLMPRSRELTGSTIDYTEQLSRKRRTVRNVIGILRGSDPARAGEAVVIGAHYDHVGLGGRYSMVPERTGEIHNGADDNASGTAAVIEMARAAVADRARFPRTLVFILFAGEERGLLGSEHYAANPVVPIRDTVFMINLDMVGRANGKVMLGGLEELPSLRRDIDAAARMAGLSYANSTLGSGRSDDASFLEKSVPAIHFFTGLHADYHEPGDDWQKVDAPGAARVAMMALELAARIAANPERPEMRR